MYYEVKQSETYYCFDNLKAAQLKAINIISDVLNMNALYSVAYESILLKYIDIFIAIQNKDYKLAITLYNKNQNDKKYQITIKKITKPQLNNRTIKRFNKLIKETIFK